MAVGSQSHFIVLFVRVVHRETYLHFFLKVDEMWNRSKFLIVYGADPVKWAKRYDIEPFSHPCYHCGIIQTTTIPFACGRLRGLLATAHECHGEMRRPPYCIVCPGSAPGDLSSLFPGW